MSYLDVFQGITFDRSSLILFLNGSALLLLFLAMFAYWRPDPATHRMKNVSKAYLSRGARHALLKTPDKVPEGLMKALIPEDRTERSAVRIRLLQAGFSGPNAVRNFFMLRLCLALCMPVIAILFFSIRAFVGVTSEVDTFLNGISTGRVIQAIALFVAVGFYGPTYWLKSKINSRRRAIELAFPNALELLQISVQAGLGLDAAMTRVGQKLAQVSPELSEEFLICQMEILAGRDRAFALIDMSERIGLDEVASFVALLNQAVEYGTSIAVALSSYAEEMREAREMRAQEKANKLPVQMSGVMATLMLPALFLITLGPIIIRYMEAFRGG